MKSMTVPARLDHLRPVIGFIINQLAAHNCSTNVRHQVEVAAEEIFVNIARYAYAPGTGEVTINCSIGGSPLQAILQFSDDGIPFNPLEHPGPDLTLPATERPLGGLGILLVRKSMDMVEYECRNGQNRLTIHKKL